MTQKADSHTGGPETGEACAPQNPMATIRASIPLRRNIPMMLSSFRRIARTLFLRSLNRSDYARWTNPDSLESWWETRTQRIATLIPKHSRVIEFGAGRRWLESYLDPSCSYIPSDLVDRGPGTIVCDLNKRPLPDLRHLRADVAVFGGVLEYIRDLESVVEWLSQQVSFCVTSYAYAARATGAAVGIRERLRRLYYGYMNNYTEEELVELFSRRGLICAEKVTWDTQQIFLFVNQTTALESQVATSGPSEGMRTGTEE